MFSLRPRCFTLYRISTWAKASFGRFAFSFNGGCPLSQTPTAWTDSYVFPQSILCRDTAEQVGWFSPKLLSPMQIASATLSSTQVTPALFPVDPYKPIRLSAGTPAWVCAASFIFCTSDNTMFSLPSWTFPRPLSCLAIPASWPPAGVGFNTGVKFEGSAPLTVTGLFRLTTDSLGVIGL